MWSVAATLLAMTGVFGVHVQPSNLDAQVRDTLRADQILSSLRQGGGGSAAVAFLNQEGGAIAEPELDAFADSLVALATAFSVHDPPELRSAAHNARVAFAAAADPASLAERTRRLTERGLAPPVPYPRSFEALVRIFEEASEPGFKAGTLYFIATLPDTARAVDFLAQVATSSESVAIPAIRHLIIDVGDPGIARLRQLYERDAVVHPVAREHLALLAHVRGWSR